MGDSQLESIIDKAWEDRESITSATSGEIRDAVEAALESMDSGKERVASPLGDHKWRVNQWLKKAVLLSFRLNDMEMISGVLCKVLRLTARCCYCPLPHTTASVLSHALLTIATWSELGLAA